MHQASRTMPVAQVVDMNPEVTHDVVDMVTQGVEKFGKLQDFEVCLLMNSWANRRFITLLCTENVSVYQGEL
mgnify:CR=1 FL=1